MWGLFSGCCSVACGGSTCRAVFCAWCFLDCGADAHHHVAWCERNPNKAGCADCKQKVPCAGAPPTPHVGCCSGVCIIHYFGSQEQLKKVHADIKKGNVQSYLDTLSPEMRAAVMKKAEAHLQDLGIVLGGGGGGGGGGGP